MSKSSKFNRKLLLSASIPAALIAQAGGAWAAPAEVNVPSGAITGATVNTSIDAAITTPANPDLTVTIDAGADVTGAVVGYDFVAGGYSAGEGDGAIVVNNDGNITGLNFGGVGSASAANSFTSVNNGEIAGGINAFDFGGDVSVTNNNLVGGSVNGSAFGAVTLNNGADAEVSGNLSGQALGDAGVSLINDGQVGGSIFGNATTGTVSVVNNGTVDGAIFASATTGAIDVTNSGEADFVDAQTTEGAISVTNAASGRIVNGVSASSDSGAITIANNGEVLGQTFASSIDTTSSSTAPTTTTSGNTTTTTFGGTQGTVGGNVTGTYAGVNGSLNFGGANDGSVTQISGKDSTATVSGTIYGDVTSAALGFEGTGETVIVETDNRDIAGTGTVVTTNDSTQTFSTTAGNSKVDITGTVASGDSGRNGDVLSFGTTSSVVNVNGGKVSGDVTSASLGGTITIAQSASGTESYTAGVLQTNPSEVQGSTSLELALTGGDASVALQGAAAVDGSVNVIGVSSASASLGAQSKVGQNVFVSTAVPGDITFTQSDSRATDAVGDGSRTESQLISVSAPAVAGNASLTNAGRIAGDADVQAGYGNATATINGSVGGSVSVSTGEALLPILPVGVGSIEQTTEYAIVGGVETRTTDTFKSSFAPAGGQASVVVDASAAVKASGTPTVAGDIFASGVGGASIDIKSGNVAGDSDAFNGGNLAAISRDVAVEGETVVSYGPDGFTRATIASTQSTKAVGGAASITNAGTAIGDATVDGLTSASLVNNGELGTEGFGNLFSVSSLATDRTVAVTDTNPDVPGTRSLVEEYSFTQAGGNAAFTNNGIAFGDVAVAGVTGSATNSGIVTGTTTLGQSQFTGTAVVDATITTTTVTVDPVAASQTYTLDQNGVSRGINVGGAVYTQNQLISDITSGEVALSPDQVDPSKFNLTVNGEAAVKSANINATVNLNNGSITLGDIDAQRDDSGAFLTNTTVNLNGSGFLGASEFKPTAPAAANYSPAAVLPEDAEGLFSPTSVRVLGVNELNKTGTGTFVIHGSEYVPADGASPAEWTLDVSNFNVKAGEVQLDVAGSDDAVFGIKGNINNDATLVLGRRAPTFIQSVGNSIATPGPEAIKGIEVYQQGDYNQSATGTTVVGVNPSLVRFSSLSVNNGGSSPEVLGPITGGVSVPYFTTPDNAGVFSTPSSVTVDGNLNLAGKVAVTVSKDSLYSNGDGYTLFSYTGTGNVTAAAEGSLASQFVSFGLKHDTTAKTVAIEATRKSYATGATNRNAAAAAVGLDGALADVVARVKTDAAGGNGFATVTEIANAQDIANIAAGLDWRLNSTQAAQVFNELSSAEIYGSLAAVDQNAVFNTTVNRLAARRSYGEALGTQLWFNPSANFAKVGGTRSGASKIKTNSYGGAFGIDIAYQQDGAFGIGFGYGQHDVTAQGSPEEAQVRTYTIGAYATQGFGPFYGSFQFAYGFSKFEVERDLTLLARTIEGDFKGKQLDASLELGYDFAAGGNLIVTPYGKLALRRWSMDGFTEEGGAGIGLRVDDASKTVFSPVLGVKAGALLGDVERIAYRPYAKVQYSFQGNIGSDRTVQYLGGGDAFRLKGVDPEGHGLIELGVDASVNKRVNLFLSGGYGFGGHNTLAQVRGGISFGF